MPAFRETVVCDAAPTAVWRIVHDPERFSEWMVDTERVEAGDDEGTVVRYLHGLPDFPMPTRVESRAEGGRVVISCLVSDIDLRVSLTPEGAGCGVEIAVTIPEGEAHREEAMRELVTASLARLAERAAAEGPPLG